MDAGRWHQIEVLFHAARARPAEEREAFLSQICVDDSELRREVTSLLAEDGSSIRPVDRPAWEGADSLLENPSDTEPALAMQLSPGMQLGPYRITGTLGAGGMGQVYSAHDSRLGRSVAVKISRARFTQRIEREARAIAALNHPNICTLYDIGANFMVMELLDGETLRTRIRSGKLPLEEVLRFGRQIADALAEAHRHSVVHRDLKPANIMLTRTGVKVLDFGLAQVAESSMDTSTETPAVMGTPAYMAPEQVKGEPVGPSADLFALGLVLFEMVEGRPPVPGVSLGSAWANGTNIAVPPLSNGPRAVRGLNELIARLLDPAPERRPPNAGEVRDYLDRIAQKRGRSQARRLAPLAVALFGLALLACAGVWWSVTTRVTSRDSLVPARIAKFTWFPGDELDPAFSPDGRAIAFSWNGDKGDNYDIYTMPVGSQTPSRLTQDPANDMSPAWSPNGRQIAFLRLRTVTEGSLVVIPSQGGPEQILCDVDLIEGIYRSMRPLLTWTPDGTGIVYTALEPETGRASLYVRDLRETAVRKLFNSSGDGRLGNSSPSFTKDGQWLAYSEVYGPFQASMYVRSVARGLQFVRPPIRVSGPTATRAESPVWAPDGRSLLFCEDAALFKWTPAGGLRQVYVTATHLAGMSATWGSDEKPRIVTAEVPHREFHSIPMRPGGLSISGDPTPFAASTNDNGNAQFSPDGKSFVFFSSRGNAAEVWVADANGRNPRQLTHLNATVIGYPRWSADSRRIAFHAWLGNKPQIYTMNAAGGAVKKLTDSSLGFYMDSWSRDGKYIYMNQSTAGPRLFRVATDGGPPENLFEGGPGTVTPDGRALVYGKAGYSGLFFRSLEGDPAGNAEEKLADDYKSPGADLNPFADGVYYVSWNGEGKPRAVRFYSYAKKTSVDVVSLSGPLRTPVGLAVSPDRRRLVYDALSGMGTDLTLIEFH